MSRLTVELDHINMDLHRRSPEATRIEHNIDIGPNRPRSKPDIWDEVIRILRKIVNFFIRLFTCCKKKKVVEETLSSQEIDMVLVDREKAAIYNLLTELDKGTKENTVLTSMHMRCLNVLTHCGNPDLQNSAAFCLLEISEKMQIPLTMDLARPLIDLLQNKNFGVLKSASLAACNFCLMGTVEINREMLYALGVLDLMIELLHSSDLELQVNASACFSALCHMEAKTHYIVHETKAVRPLLHNMRSKDIRIQRNAAGSLWNLSQAEYNRNELVSQGVIPALVEGCNTEDEQMQYYVTGALSNFAVNEKHRILMIAVGRYDIIRHLVRLIEQGKSERVIQESCLAIRGLALDVDNQTVLVEYGALSPLHDILKKSAGRPGEYSAGVACLKNLSTNRLNDEAFMQGSLMSDLCHAVCDSTNSVAQTHIAGTLLNFALRQHFRVLIDNDYLEVMTFALLDLNSTPDVHLEITATLAALAVEDEVKEKLVHLNGGKAFRKLVTLAALSPNMEVRCNCALILNALFQAKLPPQLKDANMKGIILYIDNFLKSPYPAFVQTALFALDILLKDTSFLKAFTDQCIGSVVDEILSTQHQPRTQELALNVTDKLHGVMFSSSSSED